MLDDHPPAARRIEKRIREHHKVPFTSATTS
jgi:hypothetical protein